jgi:chemotaxis protein CheC
MNNKKKDALQEAGNIGAGYAITALSKLIDQQIMIDVTRCRKVKINDITSFFGDTTKYVVGINMLIPTRYLCSVLMFLPYESALKYCDRFRKKEVGTTKRISYDEFILLTEIGTISLCAYLNALSKLLNVQLIPTPPAVACDAIGSIMEDIAPSADTINDHAIFIETNFIEASNRRKDNNDDRGNILYIPDRDSKNAILNVFNS